MMIMEHIILNLLNKIKILFGNNAKNFINNM